LNSELNEELPWGPLRPIIGKTTTIKVDDFDEDIMAEPHTKGYLLIQAFLVKAKLPISDYINDTKSVLDQLPRLLAAMESIAMNNLATEGRFDLICMFAITRQVINTRSMVSSDFLFNLNLLLSVYLTAISYYQPGGDPFLQFSSFTKDKVKKMKKRGLTLRDIVEMTDKEKSTLGLSSKNLLDIRSLPIFVVQNISLSFIADKTSQERKGTIKFELLLKKNKNRRRRSNNNQNEDTLGFVAAIGTQHNNFLLAHKTVTMVSSGTRGVELTFDWDLAKSCCTSDDDQKVLLRVLSTNAKGLDLEFAVPLNETKK